MNLLIDFVLIGGIFATLLILFLLIKSEQKALPQKLLILFFAILFCFLLNNYAENHNIPIKIGCILYRWYFTPSS